MLATAEVSVTEIVDVRTSRGRMELGFTLSQIQSATNDRDAYEACQEVAAAAHQQGFHGLVTPAATSLGDTLALFSNRLPDNGLPTVIDETFWDQPTTLGPRTYPVCESSEKTEPSSQDHDSDGSRRGRGLRMDRN